MKFISPKVDYAFKKIFGSDQSQEILISFLNAIIYSNKNVIRSLTILNPYNPGKVRELKESYLDVRAILYDGSTVIIEMQVSSTKAFDKRVAYNLAKTYANQLGIGEGYWLLNPVIAINIADFIMFQETPKVVTKFIFKEEEESFKYKAVELQLIFIELPKFNKTLSELNSLTDKWIYFIKEAATWESIPAPLAEVSAIEKALNIANQANLTVEELEELERRAIMLQDETGRIIQAKDEGILQGKLGVVTALLQQRFGEIPKNISRKIEGLSGKNLERLVQTILSFNSLEDLSNWLEQDTSAE